MRKYVIGAVVLLAVLAALLYLVHPLGPLFLLLSVLVQAPIIFGISRHNFKTSYIQRSEQRRAEYEKEGDGEAWLAAEEAEARSVGYKYWSRAGRSLNALNRADALCAVGREADGRAALEQAEYMRLEAPDRKRYDALAERLKAE